MRKWYGPVMLLLILSLALAACTSGTTSPPAATPASPSAAATADTADTAAPVSPASSSPATAQPQYGGVFKQIETMSPMNIGDPAIVPGIPTYYAPSGESLFYSDKEGSPVPCLATSWEFSPDKKYVDFHLRKGVKFQDGTDFNAQAVKFCLDRGINGQAPGLKPITSVEVIDDYTVRVNWPAFDYSVWDTLGGHRSPSWIVSPESIKTHDAEWPKNNMVGTGAFKFISYARDVGIKYEKFDSYWQKGLPYLDRVEMLIMADATTALMSLKAGEADMMRNLSTAAANDLKKDGRLTVVETPGMSYFMAFSSKNPDSPFSNLKVRQAACYAVDTQKVAEGIGMGYYLPANQAFPPWNWGHNPDIKGYPYDPAKAKQLLAEAGYPDGFKTSIFMETGPSQDVQVAVQSYLRAVGIEAEVKPMTGPAIQEMRTNTGWDGLMTGQLLTIAGMDPGALMQGMGFITRGPYYISVQRTDDTLDLLNKANAEVEVGKRKDLLHEMGRLSIDQYAMVLPIYFTQGLTGVNPAVRDIGHGEFRYTYEKAWISK